ncbi:MAG: hypothetical protein ACRENO_09060 [Thermodesulfobacteriota bacterium]
MPLYEYECEKCINNYNSDIDTLVAKLNKTNASKIFKTNRGFTYIELSEDKTGDIDFEFGEKGKSSTRKFRYKLENNKVLYLELKNFRFSELVSLGENNSNDIECPICEKHDSVRRVFSTFKAIFDDKSKRAPKPGDDLKWHLEYKQQKDEEMRNDWIGPDHLSQYFNR